MTPEYVMVPREATPEMLATWSMFEHEGAAFAYRAMLQSAPPAPAPMADALLTIIRMAEKAKEPVFREDPESPAAIRNVKFSGIAQIAAQGLGWMQGPPLDSAPPAPVAHSKSEYKRRVAMGDANVLPPAPVAVQPAPVAWRYRDRLSAAKWGDWRHTAHKPQGPASDEFEFEPLYASPPPDPVAAPVVTDAQIDEREAFENYLRGRFGQDAGWFLWRAGPDGCYVYMQSEWEAWQARAILAAHPTQESEHG